MVNMITLSSRDEWLKHRKNRIGGSDAAAILGKSPYMNKITDLSKRKDLENLQTIIYQLQYQEVLKQQIDTVLDQLQTNEYTRIEQYRADCYTDGYAGGMYNIAKSSGMQ